jgi:hypothetical protein
VFAAEGADVGGELVDEADEFELDLLVEFVEFLQSH